tara:strand:+ start:2376 stop:2711 length:336 start_codon:yes stop_codon:yes gene_type:complete
MELKGKLKSILETQIISDKFKKRSAILETVERFPQILQVIFVQDKVSLLDSYQIGQHVTISINLRGNVWEKAPDDIRYFTELNGWKIDETVEEVTNGIQNEARVESFDEPF